MSKQQRILFIDRDGTLIQESAADGQLSLESNVIPVLLSLKNKGYKLVMLSDSESESQQQLTSILKSQGVTFEEVLTCPDSAKSSLSPVQEYLTQGLVDFTDSYVIGNSDADVQLAKNMGIVAIQYNAESNNWKDIEQQLTKKERVAEVVRKTSETDIRVYVDLDRVEKAKISTGIGFFDHMLDQISTHGGFYMELTTDGDIHIDDHHSVEDTALALGQALKQALGDKRGIGRYGFSLPMDECKAEAVMDISGRPYLVFNANFTQENVGEMSTQMVEHFFYSLAQSMGLTLHLSITDGNAHHQVEGLFKVFSRALRMAIKVEGEVLPSSKGAL